MENNKTTMEKDYELLRRTIIYSILPNPIKIIYNFIIITICIFLIRFAFSADLPGTTIPDMAKPMDICANYWHYTGSTTLYCSHSIWQVPYDIIWGIWHLFYSIVLYAYLGIN
jgi:hypothetical protein